MYYRLDISTADPVRTSESVTPFLPGLLYENLQRTTFFDGRVRLEYISRPGENSFDFHLMGSRLILVAGYVRKFGNDTFMGPKEIMSSIDEGSTRFGGQYSIIVIDYGAKHVDLYTTLSRLIPTYWSNSMTVLNISNRQSEIAPEASQIDFEAMTPFLGQGYFPHESSLFKGVSIAPADSKLTWSVNQSVSGPQVRPLSEVPERMGLEEPVSATFDAIAEALRRAFLPVVPELPTKVGLTGGRDSRLIAACLHVANVDFSTFTRANTPETRNDADVRVAQQVANTLNVPHKAEVDRVHRPSTRRTSVNLIARLTSVARNTDFSVFGHETLDANPKVFDVSTIGYNGGGGELLRQAYGSSAWQSAEAARRRIRRHADGAKWGAEELWYSQWVEEWLEKNHHLPPGGMLNKFSLLYRTGRWGSGVYSSLFAKVNQRPYYDNEVLTLVLPVATDWAASDVLYYEILSRIAPGLLDVPFSGSRPWSLHRAPSYEHQRHMETLPPPLGDEPNEELPRVPWRQRLNGPLGADLLTLVERASEYFGLLTPDAVNRLKSALAGVAPNERNGALAKRLWASASAGVQLAMVTGSLDVFDVEETTDLDGDI